MHKCEVCHKPTESPDHVCHECMLLATQALVNAAWHMREIVGYEWCFWANNPSINRLYHDTCNYMQAVISWQEQYQE